MIKLEYKSRSSRAYIIEPSLCSDIGNTKIRHSHNPQGTHSLEECIALGKTML